MERSILIVMLLCAILALGACAGKKLLTPDQQQCFDLAVNGCDPAAQKACEGKSDYVKDECVRSSVRVCESMAGDECRKQFPSQ